MYIVLCTSNSFIVSRRGRSLPPTGVRNLWFFSWGSGVSLVGGGLARLSGEGYLIRPNAMRRKFSTTKNWRLRRARW